MKRLVIVDDHYLLRAGWSYLIDPEEDLEIVGSAGSVSEALQVIENTSPDLVITDLSLPERGGIELIKDLAATKPSLPVLVVSMYDEILYGERVLKAGGRGYLMKEAVAGDLVTAIRRVLNGKIHISQELSDHILRGGPGSPLKALTDREVEVFEKIGRGLSLEEIAEQLSIGGRTVEAHRTNIRNKLGFHDAHSLLRYCVRWVEAGDLSK